MKKLFTLVCALAAFSFAHAQLKTGVSITLRVDMSNYITNGGVVASDTAPHIAGNFSRNGDSLYTNTPYWTPGAAGVYCKQLGTSNIYAITLNLKPSDSIQWKFLNGNAWGTCDIAQECTFPVGNTCLFNNNRLLLTGTRNVTYTFCWDSCNQCTAGRSDTLPALGVNNVNPDFNHFSVNYSNNTLHLNYSANNDVASSSIIITDMLGQTVKALPAKYINYGFHTENINVADLASGMYMVSLKSGGDLITKKFIIAK